MASPAKKRKLNSDVKKSSVPSRGIEHFFAKQRQNGPSSSAPTRNASLQEAAVPDHELTDEELARKLQAEWNKEDDSQHGERQDASLSHESTQPAPSTTTDTVVDGGANTSIGCPAEPPRPRTPPRDKGKGTLSLQSVASSADSVAESIPFDQSPLTFDPGDYVPALKAHWAKDDGNASYALLTRCFVLINGTTSRIKIVDTLVNCLRVLIEADPASLLPAVGATAFTASTPRRRMLIFGRYGWQRTRFPPPTFRWSWAWGGPPSPRRSNKHVASTSAP